jgi:hypothetical protein
MRVDERLHFGHRSGGVGARRRERSRLIVEPHNGIPCVSREADRAVRLERQGDDARPRLLGAEFVGERRHLDPLRAVSRRHWTPVGDVGRIGVVRAQNHPAPLAIPPRIGDHAVRARLRPGADRRMPGAGHRSEVWVSGVVEIQPFVEQQPESPLPVPIEGLQVVRAELIDDEYDDEPGRTLGGRRASNRSEAQQDDEQREADVHLDR